MVTSSRGSPSGEAQDDENPATGVITRVIVGGGVAMGDDVCSDELGEKIGNSPPKGSNSSMILIIAVEGPPGCNCTEKSSHGSGGLSLKPS